MTPVRLPPNGRRCHRSLNAEPTARSSRAASSHVGIRRYAETENTIPHWVDVEDRGGHFAALEEPALLTTVMDLLPRLALAVTEAGAAMAARAIEIFEAADQAFFAAVDQPDRLLGALRQLAGWPDPGS